MVCSESLYLLIFLYHIHAKVLDQEGSVHNPHKKLSHLYYVPGTETQYIDLLPTKCARKLECSVERCIVIKQSMSKFTSFLLKQVLWH